MSAKFTSATTVVTSSPRSTMQAFRCLLGEKLRELIPNTVEASGESICRWSSARQHP